jgi:hypothetical protein
LKEFVPDKKTATPGNRGRQRLGIGDRPQDDDDENGGDNGKPKSYNQAKDTIKKFNYGFAGAKAVGGPIAGPGAGTSMSGFAIPMALSSFMVGKTTDIWHGCIDQLGGDPPDPNYDEYAELVVPDYEHMQASEWVPQARADKFNVILDASMNLSASLRAAIASLDKHGGAIEAGDSEWIIRQAEAIVYYKRLSGVYMYDVAEALLGYTDHMRSEGFGDIMITAENFREYQDELRANGFSEDELNAARILDFSDEEIDESLDRILSADPDEMEGNFLEALDDLAWVLYEVGWDLYSNWDVVPPGDWDADFGTLYISP